MDNIVRTLCAAAAGALLLFGTLAVRAAGVTAPRFDLPALDGKHYTENYLLGRPTLVVFWASWCPVCQAEFPKLHELFDETKDRGLQVLAIGFADDLESIRRYVNTHSDIFDFPILYDPKDDVAKRFGVVGTPTIYLVNERGEIEYTTWLFEDPALKRSLDTLLDARGKPGTV